MPSFRGYSGSLGLEVGPRAWSETGGRHASVLLYRTVKDPGFLKEYSAISHPKTQELGFRTLHRGKALSAKHGTSLALGC